MNRINYRPRRFLAPVLLVLSAMGCRTPEAGKRIGPPLKSAIKFGNAVTSVYGDPFFASSGVAGSLGVPGGIESSIAAHTISSIWVTGDTYAKEIKYQDSAITEAIKKGSVKDVQWVIDKGYNIFYTDGGNYPFIRELLWRDLPDAREKMDLIFNAIRDRYGNERLITYLNEESALVLATGDHKPEFLQYFLDLGVTGGAQEALDRVYRIYQSWSNPKPEDEIKHQQMFAQLETKFPELRRIPEHWTPPEFQAILLNYFDRGEIETAYETAMRFRKQEPLKGMKGPSGQSFLWDLANGQYINNAEKPAYGQPQFFCELFRQNPDAMTSKDSGGNTLLMTTIQNGWIDYSLAIRDVLEEKSIRQVLEYLEIRNHNGQTAYDLLEAYKNSHEKPNYQVRALENWFEELQ